MIAVGKRGPKRAEDRTDLRDEKIPPIRVSARELEMLQAGAAAENKTLGVWLLELGLKRAKRLAKKH